jgi:hypothetical protein
VEVAGLVALLRPAKGVEVVDLQLLVEEVGWLGFQRSAGEADWLASQRRLRTGLSNLHGASLKGCSIEYLLHARAEDSHHHLFERT